MKICAIILDYRNASSTANCLRSLHGEGICCALVVDNSAEQQSSQRLAAAIETLSSEVDYALKLLHPATNLGFAGGVNYALNASKAETRAAFDAYLLLNNDATIAPGAVAKMVAAMENDEADLVAPTIVDENGHVQPVMWYQRFFGLLTDRKMRGAFFYLSGCCLLIRNRLTTGEQFLDESFFMYGEDTFLGWQLSRRGIKQLLLDTATVRHKGQDPKRTCNLFYEYHLSRAHILLACKAYRHPLEIPLMLLTKSMGLMVRLTLRSIRYRSGVPIIAFLLSWFPIRIRKS